MARLSIGQVARRTGLETSAIRYYESIGLLPEPERASGRRVYGNEVFPRIGLIKAAKQSGFTIAEIRHLLHGFEAGTPASDRWGAIASEKARQIDEQIAQLERSRDRLQLLAACRCVDLDTCAEQLPLDCD